MKPRQPSTTHRFNILLMMLILTLVSACSTVPQGKRGSRIPAHVTVDAGPNRALAITAMRYLGTPYVYGGTTPDGFDCSGLVQFSANKALNLKMPRRAVEQASVGQSIALRDAKAGDLLFFNTDGQPYSHVGIYVGQTYFVHAPSSNGAVRIEDFSLDYWQKRFTLAKRVK